MPDEQPIFELDLGEHGGVHKFETHEQLKKWSEDEFGKWRWLGNFARSQTEAVWQEHQNFQNRVNQHGERWRQELSHPLDARRAIEDVKQAFTDYIVAGKILDSTNPKAVFVFDLKEKRGPVVAAGAYISLIPGPLRLRDEVPAEFTDGLIEGFLFKREVDWTARAHAQALGRLKSQYQKDIEEQKKRATEIEGTNQTLNESFTTILNQKRIDLEKLHADQIAEFLALSEKHVANLKGIEDAYNQKLALQKPVEYWEDRESHHVSRSRLFGAISLAVGIGVASGMGLMVHWIFADLDPKENPRHWQLGILLVAAFFAVWLVRIFVRLFLSHLHLATDAAERRTMILTYLSMAREGADVKPEDKKLILQHIFRSASDGLVKDDAAPPGVWEWATRGK